MRINLVVKSGWILERMARELAGRLPGVTVNAGCPDRQVDASADVHYYLPAKDLQKYPTDARAVGLYTHGENGFELVPRLAACVAMNQQMAARLTALGAASVTVIRPGTDPPARPIVFGVVGRVYNDGRKGEHLVTQALAAGYTFIACGPEQRIRAMARRQWPCPRTHTTEERDAFYAAIDYLVVTATVEGGPVPVLEAIARGVPVIAPDVGWSWEFPVIHYECGSWPSLQAVLQGLTAPPSWAEWADGHRRLFATLATSGRAA